MKAKTLKTILAALKDDDEVIITVLARGQDFDVELDPQRAFTGFVGVGSDRKTPINVVILRTILPAHLAVSRAEKPESESDWAARNMTSEPG